MLVQLTPAVGKVRAFETTGHPVVAVADDDVPELRTKVEHVAVCASNHSVGPHYVVNDYVKCSDDH